MQAADVFRSIVPLWFQNRRVPKPGQAPFPLQNVLENIASFGSQSRFWNRFPDGQCWGTSGEIHYEK